jgi:hypothetical protein
VVVVVVVVVTGGVVTGGVVGGRVVVVALVGGTAPVHVVPLRAKLDGTGLVVVHEPLKPNAVLALVAMVRL